MNTILSFIMGLVVGLTIMVIGEIICTIKSERIAAQDYASSKYLYTDSLWYKTSKNEQLKITYCGQDVHVWVEQLVFEGTNHNCKMHRVYINDTACAVIMKIRDTYEAYFCAYIIEPYMEKEIWDILEAAYNRSMFKEAKPAKSIVKESVLK